jgi:hypothetical protein
MKTFVYLNEKQAAEYLGMAAKTLARWRGSRRGPTFTKLGGSVRYKIPDLEKFAAAGVVHAADVRREK